MPELPDVESFRQYLESTSLHKEIVDVDVRSRQILEIDAERLRTALKGRRFEGTRRHGKYLFVHLDDDRWLELHFGMSGNLRYFRDMEDDPEYDRLLFSFANGYYLAYTTPRKLGEVDVLDDPTVLIEEKDLGPDVMGEGFDLTTFKRLLADRRGMIKSALMDQQLMSGIGNVYSDEILFQAKIHPRTKVQALTEDQLEALYDVMQEVLEVSTGTQVRNETFPPDYLTPHHHQDGACPICGEALHRVRVSGRSAYFCPKRQGEPKGA
ncbi:MAG: Fpg/Nei family DNA glycosylase [Anaerolineae bacterium]